MANSLTHSDGLADGTINPAEVFSAIDAAVDEITIADLSSKTIGVNYNALTGNRPNKKQTFGKFKEPVPARLSVMDMDTAEYVATSTKFILTSVRREKREKFQVLHGFGEEWLLSVFGKEASIYSIAGTLVNLSAGIVDRMVDSGHGMDWVRDLDEYYDNYLRAYQLVQRNRQAVLHYSNRMIRGYIIGKIETDNSEAEYYVPFSLNMLVRRDKMY